MTTKKTFLLIFSTIAVLEVFSYWANFNPALNTSFFFIIVALSFAASLRKLEYGIYFVAAELIIGSFGYLFAAFPAGLNLSLRMGLFAAVMAAWLIAAVRERRIAFWRSKTKWLFVFLGAWTVVGVAAGYLNGHNPADIFFDFNTWLYFLIVLPVYEVFFKSEPEEGRRKFLRILAIVCLAALSSSIFKSLVLLYIFSHNLKDAMPPLYKWVRDTRVGEITRADENFFRIFFQSQIYSLLAFFPMLMFAFGPRPGRPEFRSPQRIRHYFLPIIALLSVLVSFSRSFWLAWLATLGGLAVYVFITSASRWKNLARFIASSAAVLFFSSALMFVIVKFPAPSVSSDYSLFKSLQDRFKLSGEAAVSSRWSLLGPLWEAIKTAPPKPLGIIIGKGFGAPVTYKTEDPTVLILDSSGTLTTYAFEWGWLDIWLKLGLVGVTAYLFLLYRIFRLGLSASSSARDSGHQIIYTGLAFSILALAIAHIFTPYLNHPLGIGALIFLAAAFESAQAEQKMI